MAKRTDIRRVKGNRSYLVDEAAAVTFSHRNTVRNWIKQGLTVVDGRPLLILGADLIAFHRGRREKARTTSPPGTIFCLPCRTPQRPAGDTVEFIRDGAGAWRLEGLCPRCGRLISRITSEAQLCEVACDLDVHHVQPPPTL